MNTPAPEKPLIAEVSKPDEAIAGSFGAWISAVRANPDSVLTARGASLTVYDELLRDDQVRSTLQQRRTALTQAEWHVDPASESALDVAAAEDLRAQLEAIRFDDATDKMLYGLFYGWATAECMWRRDGARIVLDDILVRDRSRFGFNWQRELLLITRTHPMGAPVPPRKFWTFSAGASHDDNPYGLGLAHSVYWPVFFKRNGLKFWMIFLEKFGMPTAVAKLPPGQIDQQAERSKALQALSALQADAGIVIPDTMVIELLEAARSGTADYDALQSRMDAAISKVVLSQTMTTDDGASLSQAKVHAGVAEDVIKSDADLICDSFNRGPARWLTEWNFPGAGIPRVWRKTEQPEDATLVAERFGKIAALGFEPSDELVEETFGPGWIRKPPAPTVAPPAFGPMGPEFAEITKLAQDRVAHRADQQQLADAAKRLSGKYRELYGSRVEQLLSYLEETDDAETFSQRIAEMMAESPSPEAVETIQRANLVGRLMGLLRGQR